MFMTHLECSLTGERHDADRPQNLSGAGKPLLARYDLEAVASRLARAELASRPAGMWKWPGLLPLPDEAGPLSLGEVETPLVPRNSIGGRDGCRTAIVQDRGRPPTRYVNARGMAARDEKKRPAGRFLDHERNARTQAARASMRFPATW